MWRKFDPTDVSSKHMIRASVQRHIREQILTKFPEFSRAIRLLFPKSTLQIAKCPYHVSLLLNNGEGIFFQQRDGDWIPTLRLIHRYPDVLPKMKVDSGAIRHVLRGSNIMCPGLTSPGGAMSEVETGTMVAIHAEGKQHACAIGRMTLSTKEIREKNKDVCIETYHYLGDGLWLHPHID